MTPPFLAFAKSRRDGPENNLIGGFALCGRVHAENFQISRRMLPCKRLASPSVVEAKQAVVEATASAAYAAVHTSSETIARTRSPRANRHRPSLPNRFR